MKRWVKELHGVSRRMKWRALAANAAWAALGAALVCWWREPPLLLRLANVVGWAALGGALVCWYQEPPLLVGVASIIAGVAVTAGVFWRDWVRPAAAEPESGMPQPANPTAEGEGG